jgi:hypothetical protein
MASRKKSDERDEIVVFSIVRDSTCSECGVELWKGEFLRMEGDRPLCMACADLDRLVFLPSGNTLLTRRASKHSTLRAVVVRFSRSRKRYERQGILVEEAALEQAEQECLADADARELARERAAKRRAREDAEYVSAFASRVGELFPGCPAAEQRTIVRHACLKHSGRVGRSSSAKQLEASSIELAVRAHVRHAHTCYDELLARGRDRRESRAQVAPQVKRVVEAWQSNRRGGLTRRCT